MIKSLFYFFPDGTFVKKYWIVFLYAIFLSFAVTLNLITREEQQYVYITESFLKGHLYFVEKPDTIVDTVLHKGRLYWSLAPGPSLLLLPFTWLTSFINVRFYQGYLQLFLSFGIIFFCYYFARLWNYRRKDSLWLSFAFCFSTVSLPLIFIPSVWYFAQIISAFFVFLSFYLWHTKRSWWLIGFCMAIVFATRFTAGLSALYFIMIIIRNRNFSLKEKFFSLSKIGIPIIMSGCLLLVYNQMRFGDPFDNGYTHINNATATDLERYELINYGLFQLRNIPTNIYYYFLKGVDPVLLDLSALGDKVTYILRPPYIGIEYPGTSFFITSPIFLYILFRIRKLWNIENVKLLLINALLILTFLMLYYWPGAIQTGPRYMLDLMPLLYFVLLYSFPGKKLSANSKVIISISAFVNLYFFFYVFVRFNS